MAYAAGAPIVTDDRTRLDFTVARSIESNFGLFNSNMNDWLLGLTNPDLNSQIKIDRMCGYKRSVLEHLTNGDGPIEGLAEIGTRLEALEVSSGPRCVGSSSQ